MERSDLVQELGKAMEPMIISASGWRKVFSTGGPESADPCISEADALLSGCAALAVSRIVKPSSCVLVGTDTRPTGKALARAAVNVFNELGIRTRFLGISAAPEIMAESRNPEFDCFFYISASHNPIGHNGFKFGSDGGVFSKEAVQPIIDAFMSLTSNGEELKVVQKAINGPEPMIGGKQQAIEDYKDFVLLTMAGSKEAVPRFEAGLREADRLGVAIDFNGSARALSIDRNLFDELGIRHAEINAHPGEIVHAIVPERENLQWCRKLLEQKHRDDPCFILGYMPDNDGDRGNLVFIDDDQTAKILPAQTVFALAVLCQLSAAQGNLAVAVNGPTSMRIDDIAQRFGAKCFRSEVGEANAVSLASELRGKGFTVPICGEGSNGGSIVYPSKVRDPLNTILSLLKFLSNRDEVFAWMGKESCTIGELVRSLPVYTTTDAFSPLAGIKVRSEDFCAFKTRFEKLWEGSSELRRMGICSWEEFQLEGTSCLNISGPDGRTGNCRGGLKYVLYGQDKQALGFVWLRPSGTEPLLRLLVDLKGDHQQMHDRLLSFERKLIEQSDLQA
ncbi:MAG: phosphoglucomutase [Sphaerochaetaceae bacterium]|jgi:phosphoglucomutase|nr:phosphoglucomutase [Sphaerochaetaceae bacterium]MDD3162674.1 phosphoglucomutase [Sphaerochaetaceae bacterium]MDD4006888.1 phosphoglucomutase [Sphaerochaetaceae bacterium]MDD4396805.1 phosphoglucomutase [Sphaerochaetaceae bacterium]